MPPAPEIPSPLDLPAAEELVRQGMSLQKAGALDEADAIFRVLLDAADPVVRSLGWRHVAGVHRLRSEWTEAVAAARRAAEIAEQVGIREPYAEALNAEAIVYQMQGDFDRAVPLLEKMLYVTADPKGQGIALQNLGSIAAQRGDFETARKHFMQSHDCFQRAGYTHGVAFVLNNFGRAALDHANARMAQSMLQSALQAARDIGDRDLEALVNGNLAEAALALGETGAAARLLDAAQSRFAAEGNRLREAECVRLRGELAEKLGDVPGAIAHYERAHAVATELGARQESERTAARLSELRGPK
ncbi:MAG: tetratricopeptide repeat protein [Gemmatimonadaceae bacterium]|nr:tetratricopeptide repeat protein [Gemmatimonadaceae bacterium]NUS98641.1 tetratricopeptide repeat protein [Gemmatimonadaceae bacterium]